MSFGRDVLAATQSQDVQQSPAASGRIQHGVIKDGTFKNLGDGTEDDMSATVQTFIGNSGAYFDTDAVQQQALPQLATLATWAIGFLFAPRGEERTLALPTERSFAVIFEHGFEDVPQGVNPGEVYMLHRSGPVDGSYDNAIFNAGIRYLNDASEDGDDLGATEVGYQGARTKLQTKGGWLIDEDDTADTLTIYWPDGSKAAVFDDNAGKIELAGSTGSSNDAVIRESDLAAFAADIRTWASAHFQTGSSSPPAITTPPGSTILFSG